MTVRRFTGARTEPPSGPSFGPWSGPSTGHPPVLRHSVTAVLVAGLATGLVTRQTWHRPDLVNRGSQPAPDRRAARPAPPAHHTARVDLRDWLHRDGRRPVGFGQRTEVRVIAAPDDHGHAWQLIRSSAAAARPRPTSPISDSTGQRIAAGRVLTALHHFNPARPQPLNRPGHRPAPFTDPTTSAAGIRRPEPS